MNDQLVKRFISSWRDTIGTGFVGELERQSLEASVAGIPELENALSLLKRQGQTQVELHLGGARVRGHAANAAAVGEFVKGLSAVVKELTKSAQKVKRLPEQLLVYSPEPGSLKLTLTVPPPEKRVPDAEVLEVDAPAETEASRSLDRAIRLLSQAEQDADVLPALTRYLSIPARKELKRTVRVLRQADWEIEGELHSRIGKESIRLTERGADALLQELDVEQQVKERVTVVGRIDGHRTSTASMWFAPNEGKTFIAAVRDPDLLHQVRELAAFNSDVTAEFLKVESMPAGARTTTTRSRELLGIQLLDTAETIV